MKLDDMINQHLGKKTDDMVLLSGLATTPASQGKGYGTALVVAITSMVRSRLIALS